MSSDCGGGFLRLSGRKRTLTRNGRRFVRRWQELTASQKQRAEELEKEKVERQRRR